MIVQTSGYADEWGDAPTELTTLLASNQVSIEHRYYGTSRPVPTDWSYLTIKQMADDEHDILDADASDDDFAIEAIFDPDAPESTG